MVGNLVVVVEFEAKLSQLPEVRANLLLELLHRRNLLRLLSLLFLNKCNILSNFLFALLLLIDFGVSTIDVHRMVLIVRTVIRISGIKSI